MQLGGALDRLRLGSDAFQERRRREGGLRHGRGRQHTRREHGLGDGRRMMAAARQNCDEGADLSTNATEQEDGNNQVKGLGRWQRHVRALT